MTDSNYTAIMIISDRSGSMNFIQQEAEASLNSFIKEQSKLNGKCTIRLVDFDHEYRVIQKSRSAKKFPRYSLEPRGMTALYDAIGRGVVEFGEELSDLTEEKRPAKVLVVIITDGQENSSKEYTVDKLKEMIKHQCDVYNWEFLFLAANQDAALSGGLIGIRPDATLTYDATSDGITRSSLELSRVVSTYRSTGQAKFSVDKQN